MKRRIYFGIGLIIIFILFLIFNDRQPRQRLYSFQGNTMGTTYTIKYNGVFQPDLKQKVDDMLVQLNKVLSTYDPNSLISNFNQGGDIQIENTFFLPVLEKSEEIYKASDGNFDPTIMPLVNAWGFGPESKQNPDSVQVDSLMQLVGFHKLIIRNDSMIHNDMQLDFSAIAKGFGVDKVAEMLTENGITDYLVEIGGEIRAAGVNDRGIAWTIGIEDPTMETTGNPIRKVKLEDRALATSGNYRNYYEVDGQRYAHTISPFSGYPIQTKILSTTVVAHDCMTADGWATAFMVMGLDSAVSKTLKNDQIESFLIYDDQGELKTYTSPGLTELISSFQ